MRRRSGIARRARAWLLLGLFLGAGTSLPSLDALLFHWRVDPLAGQVHVEPAGGCTAHADHCTLGQTPPGSRAVAAFALSMRLAPPAPPMPRQAAPAPPPRKLACLLPPPRAPPAPQV